MAEISRAERMAVGHATKVVSGAAQTGELIPVCAWLGCCGVNDLCSLYLKFPDCCGVYCKSQCCCCAQEDIFCKKSEIDHECCIIREYRCVQSMPYACYAGVCNWCCCDYRFSYPANQNSDVPCLCAILGLTICVDGGYHFGICETIGVIREKMSGKYHQKTVDPGESAVMKQMEIKTEVGRAEPKDLNVCCACCCDISSLFCKFPDVFGSECFWTCFCSKCGMQNCKPSVDKGDVFSGEVCLLCDCKWVAVMPRTCISVICQYNCWDRRCAFPCDGKGDVPCVVNCCFINCCYDWKCHCGQTWFHPLGAVIGQKPSADKMLLKEQAASAGPNGRQGKATLRKSLSEIPMTEREGVSNNPMVGTGRGKAV